VPDLAAAVVLDAHAEAYGSGWPGFHAADVVVERAARHGAPCLLVSSCPTAVQVASYRVRTPPKDIERNGWPAVSVVDRRGADPRTGLYSEELVRLAHRVLDANAGEPMVCVLNRTGRSRLLACAACGGLARCERCGRPVEQTGDRFHCPSCDTERPVVCAACGATRHKVLRVGVGRAREEIEALLGVPVGEVSGSQADGEPPGDEPVLVGTEAVLHRVRRAAGVAFLDFDQHLLAPRFVASEQALSLVARAGRLGGGRGRPHGTVLVQTRLPDHPVLEAAVHGDPSVTTDHELALRRELSLPPASALALLSRQAAGAYARALEPTGVDLAELGEDRWLVRAPDHTVLCDALAATERPAGALRVEVDPLDV
jgi:primosomal protein N' (replication factor Y)